MAEMSDVKIAGSPNSFAIPEPPDAYLDKLYDRLNWIKESAPRSDN